MRNYCLVLMMLFISQLVACTNSDSNNGSSNQKPLRPTVHLYSDGFLRAYFPGKAQTSEPIVPQNIQAEDVSLIASAYVGEDRNLISRIYSTQAFYESEGQLWKLMLNDSDNLKPIQVSSASNLDRKCGSQSRGITGSGFFYEMPGADNDCTIKIDNVFLFINDQDDELTAPKIVTEKLDNLYGGLDFIFNLQGNVSISGFLVINNNELIRYDANFENPVSIKIFDSVDVVKFPSLDLIIFKNQVSVGDVYYAYDDQLMQLNSNPLLTIPTTNGAFHWLHDRECYRNECVLAVANSTSNTFYILDVNGKLPAQLVPTVTNSRIFYLGSTLSSIFYTKGVTIENQAYEGLYQVSKFGGEETLVDYGSRTILQSVNSSIYYNREMNQQLSAVIDYTAIIVDSAGQSVAEYPNSLWIGAVGSTMEITDNYKHIILARNYTLAENGVAGAVLEVFSTDTNQKVLELGRIPDDVYALEFDLSGDSSLVHANINRGLQQPQVSDTDIFYYDINVPGSFTRVTNTPNIDEKVIR